MKRTAGPGLAPFLFIAIVLIAPMTALAQDFALHASPMQNDIPLNALIGSSEWNNAARADITWNVDFHQPAQNPTEVRVLLSQRYMYLLFEAHQRQPVVATQTSDGSGVDSDDHIGLYIWPGGANGFRYFFEANPLGARYQESTENTNFAPDWYATAKRTSDGYIEAVRIPLNSMRGDGGSTWRLQLDRYVSATQEQNVWAFAADQRFESQVPYAGYLTGMAFAARQTRARARFDPFFLTRVGSPAAGGSAATTGIDLAVPVTGGISFVGTIHPDYSNVELNQQTISPTVFPRTYLEVRPFFVQGASFYNHLSSLYDGQLYTSSVLSQPLTSMLYTPSIPTPASGFAVEGYQGNLGLAAFDSTGYGRDDNAQSFSWSDDQQKLSASVQRVSVRYPGFSNTAAGASVQYDNQHTGYVYATVANDRGTDVPDPSQAAWEEIGAAYRRPQALFGVSLRKIGRYYEPADGYVANSDIAGYAVFGHRFLTFARTSPLLALSLDAGTDTYHGRHGEIDQADTAFQLSATTRTLFSVTAIAGSHSLVIPAAGLLPFNQNGFSLGYLDGTSTPTDITLESGRYGAGYLNTVLSSSNIPIFAHKGTISLMLQGTDYRSATESSLVQWLESASVNWELSQHSSFSVGVREIQGTAPPYPVPTTAIHAVNVSAAFHYFQPYGEIYAAYGNPNQISTYPAAIVKYIFYIGSAKGT